MNTIKKHKNKIITGAIIVLILALTFFFGGNAPSNYGFDNKTQVNTVTESITPDTEQAQNTEAQKSASAAAKTDEAASASGSRVQAEKETPKKQTDKPQIQPEKTEPEAPQKEVAPSETKNSQTVSIADPNASTPEEPDKNANKNDDFTCTLSVRCDTILRNIQWLDPEKVELVPKNGIILAEQTVTFYEGESVFDLLEREMRKNKIHLEFMNTPIYKSAYIEGIANLYEFDCGELSGWMYKVNGKFPGYGCSLYELENGDKVEWVYTCDLGKDVGGNYASQNGN